MTPARALAIVLFAIALLYAVWFAQDTYRVAALLVFAAPPMALALLAWRGWPRAAFVAGLLALAWFSHAVMVAWTRPDERLPAALAIVLSVAVILLPGLSRLRDRKRT